jgi:glutathione peroxidase
MCVESANGPNCWVLLLMSGVLSGASGVYEFTMNSIDGKAVPLGEFRGKVTMIVNVASRCGYTPQYAALEAVYEKYKDRRFTIAGFPANNFGEQEPGANEEIKQFCSAKYNVKFPMFAKISVLGDDIAPLYRYLTGTGGGDIEWNFTKFLVGRDGEVIGRFDSAVTPDSPEVIAAIEKALNNR